MLQMRPVGIELVYGKVVNSTDKEMNPWRERAAWFGCGKQGKYWVSIPSK
jgi:hypothetical protein